MSDSDSKDILGILELLQQTYKSNDTEKIKSAKNELEVKFKELKSATLLFKILTIKTIFEGEIPLDLHKSALIFLKNILAKNLKNLEANEVFFYTKNFLELLFIHHKTNPNIKNTSIFTNILYIISSLISSEQIASNSSLYIYQLFQIIYENLMKVEKDDFLFVARIVILLNSTFLSSKNVNQDNYEDIMNKFYIPTINIIFKNVNNFLDPKNNKYNNDFIIILKYLYDGFFINLSKMKTIFDTEKIKNIVLHFFREYGMYSFELMQLGIPFDEETKKQYGNPNPIIVFSVNRKKNFEINIMKSKIIQFLSFVTQISTMGEKLVDLDRKEIIEDKELAELINKVIVLIINSFEDILNNKEKYMLIKKFNFGISEENDCYNTLLFQIFIFLTRSLIREPIKSEFCVHLKKFLLNVLFPILVTIDEEENNFLEIDPEGYHQYLDDIISSFKNKNFRTSGCFLIFKLCDKYEDMPNFTLSFCIETINYIVNEGKIKNEIADYNIYLKNIKDSTFNGFSDKTKLDLSLLIILILKKYLLNSTYLMNSFRQVLISNQDKIHSITSPIIKIKLCRLYSYFLPYLFKDNNKVEVAQEVKIKFIENSINFILNNIVQKEQQNSEEYILALVNESADAIINFMNISKIEQIEEFDKCINNNEIESMMKYILIKLENNFPTFNKLIEFVDVDSFFVIIKQIIKEVKIEERKVLFECLENLTSKFQNELMVKNINNINSKSNEEDLFAKEYFDILIQFLKGVNKINNLDKDEVKQFNDILEKILDHIHEVDEFQYTEELIAVTEAYIKAMKGINHLSALVLKQIGKILDIENSTSLSCFNFVSTFLSYIQINISDRPLDQAELFNEILILIQKSYTFQDEFYDSSKLYALLLTLQILNLNPNISEDILSFLLNSSLECFSRINPDENNKNNDFPQDYDDEDSFPKNERNNINQLSIANISLGFIYKPELTFKILISKCININNSNMTNFELYINYIWYITKIIYPSYNPLLGKCVILGICGIFGDKNCINYLNSNIDKKKFLLKIFFYFIEKHKNEKNVFLKRLMKKEMACNFIKDNEEEEEEDDDFDEDDEYEDIDDYFNEKVEMALKGNDNIIESDEFKYFSEVMKYIKENDPQTFSSLENDKIFGNNGVLEEIFKTRNIKITYKNKEFIVPRKTVRIIRNTIRNK